jgi:hypothetical protein
MNAENVYRAGLVNDNFKESKPFTLLILSFYNVFQTLTFTVSVMFSADDPKYVLLADFMVAVIFALFIVKSLSERVNEYVHFHEIKMQ